MKRLMVIVLLAVTASACGPSHTADSIADIRWESSKIESPTDPPQLDCGSVNQCHDKGLYPDKYSLLETGEEVYVWSEEYIGFWGDSTVLWVVVNRPSQPSWDMLGFEKINGVWQVGVYEGIMMIGKTPVPKWEKTPVGDDTVAIGMVDEKWAVIIRPISDKEFEYELDEFYWP